MPDKRQRPVYILTGETGSGKTTFLLQLVRNLKPYLTIAGFAAVSVPEGGTRGRYDLLDLASGMSLPLASANSPWGWTSPGRYAFNPEAVRMGRRILEDALTESTDLIAVDEIGPFELAGKIWADPLTRLLQRPHPSVLLVVRQSLVTPVKQKWSLEDAVILDILRIHPDEAASLMLIQYTGSSGQNLH
jgi:nucleoside-triphosphatase THEP1